MALGQPGVGASLKDRARTVGPWFLFVSGFGEMLPNPENRVTLHPTRKDKYGIPEVSIACQHGDNERKMARQMLEDARGMVQAAGAIVVSENSTPSTPGSAIHEMGTACMGKDPKRSVLNGFNQAHDVPNLFCTDGAAMASSGCQNPSLTYMALSARAAHHAAEFLKEGKL